MRQVTTRQLSPLTLTLTRVVNLTSVRSMNKRYVDLVEMVEIKCASATIIAEEEE